MPVAFPTSCQNMVAVKDADGVVPISASIAHIDDNPSAPDGLWWTFDSLPASGEMIYADQGALQGTQTVRAALRKQSADYTFKINLHKNGAFVKEISSTLITSVTGQEVVATFEPADVGGFGSGVSFPWQAAPSDLSALNAAGKTFAQFDFWDSTKRYQTNATTTPATANGAPVGRVNSTYGTKTAQQDGSSTLYASVVANGARQAVAFSQTDLDALVIGTATVAGVSIVVAGVDGIWVDKISNTGSMTIGGANSYVSGTPDDLFLGTGRTLVGVYIATAELTQTELNTIIAFYQSWGAGPLLSLGTQMASNPNFTGNASTGWTATNSTTISFPSAGVVRATASSATSSQRGIYQNLQAAANQLLLLGGTSTRNSDVAQVANSRVVVYDSNLSGSLAIVGISNVTGVTVSGRRFFRAPADGDFFLAAVMQSAISPANADFTGISLHPVNAAA